MSDKTQPTDETKPKGFQQDGKGDTSLAENRKNEKDERLDEALEETFPSSDPVSVKITK
ncbi:Bacterial ubiquitin-like modifier [Methylorubrum thiocyanatum]